LLLWPLTYGLLFAALRSGSSARDERLPLQINCDAGAWCGWLPCRSQWHCHQAWPDSAFGGCLGHGIESLCSVNCWVELVVVSVMRTGGLWCHLMSVCRAAAARGVAVGSGGTFPWSSCVGLLVWFRALVSNCIL
jgi:hypothetical protein